MAIVTAAPTRTGMGECCHHHHHHHCQRNKSNNKNNNNYNDDCYSYYCYYSYYCLTARLRLVCVSSARRLAGFCGRQISWATEDPDPGMKLLG